jgi:hypothetical protein
MPPLARAILDPIQNRLMRQAPVNSRRLQK